MKQLSVYSADCFEAAWPQMVRELKLKIKHIQGVKLIQMQGIWGLLKTQRTHSYAAFQVSSIHPVSEFQI